MSQNRIGGGDIAMLGAVALAGFIAFRVMDGLGSIFELPVRAANEGLGVLEAGTDAAEAAFSVPETVFSGVSSGLEGAGSAVGGAAGGTFDFATDIPSNVGSTVGNFGSDIGSTVGSIGDDIGSTVDNLNPF